MQRRKNPPLKERKGKRKKGKKRKKEKGKRKKKKGKEKEKRTKKKEKRASALHVRVLVLLSCRGDKIATQRMSALKRELRRL